MVTATLPTLKKVNGGIVWSPEEDNILRLYYKCTKESLHFAVEVIHDRFGIERTYSSAKNRVGVLKLTNTYSEKWTNEEKELVRKYYTGEEKSLESLQDMLYRKTGKKRSTKAIRHAAKKLHLTRPGFVHWTPEQVETLEKLIGKMGVEELVKKFNQIHNTNRSERAIYMKAAEMGLKFSQRNDWYTLDEVSQILGVGHERARRWIKDKKLKAERYGKTDETSWKIKQGDLKKFILKYPLEFTGRNINIMMYNDILCPPISSKLDDDI